MSFRSQFNDSEAPQIRDALGEAASISPVSGGSAVTVNVKFDEFYVAQGAVSELAGIESARPAVEYLTSDYPEPQQGDRVTVEGLEFVVVGIQVDNLFTVLVLESALES